MAHFGHGLQGLRQALRPFIDEGGVCAFEVKAVFGGAGGAVHRQILRGLQVERGAGHLRGHGLAQALHDGRFAVAKEGARAQVDGQPPLAQGGVVGPVHAGHGADGLHGLIGQRHARGGLLQKRHAGKGGVAGRLHAPHELPAALRGEQALGDGHVEQRRQQHRAQRGQQRERLARQHGLQGAAVGGHGGLQRALHGAAQAAGAFLQRLQPARAHHGRERERDHGGDEDGDGQRDREFAKQPPDHFLHEQQRNEHRHQRDGERDDGEADLPRPLQRGLHGRLAHFAVAGDVFDHHDGVVHHKARGNGQRHQAQVVERVAQQVHHAQAAQQRNGHGHAGNHRGARAVQKAEDDQHHHRHCQRQLHLHVRHRGADAQRAVGQHGHLHAARQALRQLGQPGLDGVGRGNHVRARLALHVHDDGGRQRQGHAACIG